MSRDTPARRTYGPAYSAEELAILRKHYPELGGILTAELLPGRSAHSVNKKAEKLGLRYRWSAGGVRGDLRPWAPEEIERLQTLASGEGRATRHEIARVLPGRTPGAIHSKLRELDVRLVIAREQGDRCFVCDRRGAVGTLVCDHWICAAVLAAIQPGGRRGGERNRPHEAARKRFRELRRWDMPAAVCEILLFLIEEEMSNGEGYGENIETRCSAQH